MFRRQCEMCGWYSDKVPGIYRDSERLRRLEQLRRSYNDRYQEWVSANKRFEGIVAVFERRAKKENKKFKLPFVHRDEYWARMYEALGSVSLFKNGKEIDSFYLEVKKPDVCMYIPRYIECEICGHRNYIDPVKLRIDTVDDGKNGV